MNGINDKPSGISIEEKGPVLWNSILGGFIDFGYSYISGLCASMKAYESLVYMKNVVGDSTKQKDLGKTESNIQRVMGVVKRLLDAVTISTQGEERHVSIDEKVFISFDPEVSRELATERMKNTELEKKIIELTENGTANARSDANGSSKSDKLKSMSLSIKNNRLTEEVDNLKKKIAEIEATSKTKITENEAKVMVCKGQIDKLRKEKKSLQDEKISLNKLLKSKEMEFQEYQDTIKGHTFTKDDTERRESNDKELLKLTERTQTIIVAHLSRIAKLQCESEDLKKELMRKVYEKDELIMGQKNLERTHQDCIQKISELTKSLEERELTLTTLNASLKEAESSIDKCEISKSDISNELKKQSDHISELQTQLQILEEEIENTRDVTGESEITKSSKEDVDKIGSTEENVAKLSHKKAIDQIRALKTLVLQQETHKSASTNQLTKTISDYKNYITDMTDRHGKEIEALNSNHSETISKYKKELKDLEQAKNEIISKHEEAEKSKSEYQNKVKNLEETIKNTIADHKKELDEIRNTHSDEAARYKEKLELLSSQHQEAVNSNTNLSDMTKNYQNDVQNHTQTITDLTKNHEIEMNILNDTIHKYEEKVEILNETIADITSQHKMEVDELDKKVDDMSKQHDADLTKIEFLEEDATKIKNELTLIEKNKSSISKDYESLKEKHHQLDQKYRVQIQKYESLQKELGEMMDAKSLELIDNDKYFPITTIWAYMYGIYKTVSKLSLGIEDLIDHKDLEINEDAIMKIHHKIMDSLQELEEQIEKEKNDKCQMEEAIKDAKKMESALEKAENTLNRQIHHYNDLNRLYNHLQDERIHQKGEIHKLKAHIGNVERKCVKLMKGLEMEVLDEIMVYVNESENMQRKYKKLCIECNALHNNNSQSERKIIRQAQCLQAYRQDHRHLYNCYKVKKAENITMIGLLGNLLTAVEKDLQILKTSIATPGQRYLVSEGLKKLYKLYSKVPDIHAREKGDKLILDNYIIDLNKKLGLVIGKFERLNFPDVETFGSFKANIWEQVKSASEGLFHMFDEHITDIASEDGELEKSNTSFRAEDFDEILENLKIEGLKEDDDEDEPWEQLKIGSMYNKDYRKNTESIDNDEIIEQTSSREDKEQDTDVFGLDMTYQPELLQNILTEIEEEHHDDNEVQDECYIIPDHIEYRPMQGNRQENSGYSESSSKKKQTVSGLDQTGAEMEDQLRTMGMYINLLSKKVDKCFKEFNLAGYNVKFNDPEDHGHESDNKFEEFESGKTFESIKEALADLDGINEQIIKIKEQWGGASGLRELANYMDNADNFDDVDLIPREFFTDMEITRLLISLTFYKSLRYKIMLMSQDYHIGYYREKATITINRLRFQIRCHEYQLYMHEKLTENRCDLLTVTTIYPNPIFPTPITVEEEEEGPSFKTIATFVMEILDSVRRIQSYRRNKEQTTRALSVVSDNIVNLAGCVEAIIAS